MSKPEKLSTAQLLRYSLPPEKLPAGLEVWTLDFYPGDEIYKQVRAIEARVKTSGADIEGITPPYRQLNRLLAAICPTLTHGFESYKQGEKYVRQALVVGTPATPAKRPEPEDLRFVFRKWLEWWLTSDVFNKLPSDELQTFKQKLFDAVDYPPEEWGWQKRSVDTLLSPFDASLSLNYQAIPSVLAALLHDTTSRVDGKLIHWRRVQHGKEVAVIGFGRDGPLAASHDFYVYPRNKQGEGHFAYKLGITLETQAGRDDPWLFLSLHVQRYAEAAVIKDNNRNASVLVAARKARLDAFPTDTSLVTLTVSKKSGERVWADSLDELLHCVGATRDLEPPDDLFTTPQRYWRSTIEGNEYYVVHAEGYQYEGLGTGHPLEAGPSMTEIQGVLDAVLNEHLPLLVADEPLKVDPRISPGKLPTATRDFEWMNHKDKSSGKVRFSKKVPGGMEQVLSRALRGKPMHLSLFYHHDETLEGMKLALEKTLFLKDGDLPLNLVVTNHHVGRELLTGYSHDKDENVKAFHHRQRRLWCTFLQEIPKQGEHFAVVELLRGVGKHVKGVVRAACAQEGISLQGVMTIRTKQSDTGERVFVKGLGSHEHRANSALRDVLLRHTGALYGNSQEIYQAVGVDREIEVVAFHLENKRQRNLFYPLATKLSADGAVDAFLPEQNDWLPYHRTTQILGCAFEKELKNAVWKNKKWEIAFKKRSTSCLYHDADALTNFVERVLESLNKPTIVLVQAENWRNKQGRRELWSQLRNPDLPETQNVLKLGDKLYQRDEEGLENILAIIRLRSDNETPQYLTDKLRSSTQPVGLVDSKGPLTHYFSIGQRLVTSKNQERPELWDATMLDGRGSGIAFKHPQVVEMVPFFVHDDFKSEEGLKRLCRVAHYLRVAPAWSQGNIVNPYPMHLAEALVKDQLCILGMED